MKNDDVMLIQRILSGDESAFESLIRKYRKQVHAHAWRRIGDFHIAEDITQDTFLRVYQKLQTLEDPTQFSRWLHAIVHRFCIAWCRKNRIQTQPLEETNATEIQAEAYSRYVAAEHARNTGEAERNLVKKLLERLNDSDRQVVTLHYFQEMTYSEISLHLGVPESTIKSRLHRARKRLRHYEFMIQETLDITIEDEHRFNEHLNGGIEMELTFERDDLLYTLQVLQDIANGEDTSQILSNVFFHAEGDLIECIATDKEIAIRMKVEGSVKEEGQIAVSAQKLRQIVNEWQSEKPIRLITTSTNQLQITGENGGSMNVELADDAFPELPSIDDKASTIDGKALQSVLNKTRFAVPTEQDVHRHIPNGVYFYLLNDRTEVVGTDGIQLAIANCEPLNISEKYDDFILPIRAAKEIRRTFSNSSKVSISRIENQILFADEHVTLMTKLVDSKYPELTRMVSESYTRIVSESSKGRVVMQKEPIVDATHRLSLLSNPKCPSVFLDIDEQQVRISPKLSAQDEECETLPVETGTGSVSVRLNAQMLIQVLEHIETESFALEFSGTLKPVVIKPVGEVGHICIISTMSLDA